MEVDLKSRINALSYLGDYMLSDAAELRQAMLLARSQNAWFTEQNMEMALRQMGAKYLSRAVLQDIASDYNLGHQSPNPKRVGLILSGNLPIVGLHDIICVVLAGHHAVVKYSSKDTALLAHLMEELKDAFPAIGKRVEAVHRLEDIDAVIATGSNNTSGYFDTYFGKYPNIIRGSRSGVAILTGDESEEDLLNLGKDVFSYFGLGCRNVSHLVVPNRYKFDRLLGLWHEVYQEVALHHKYKNNFDFQYSTMLLNKVDFLMNGCILLREEDQIASPISVLHHHAYDTVVEVGQWCNLHSQHIQCVVSSITLDGVKTYPFGYAQSPTFTDYADGVDTMSFLTAL